MHKHLAKYISMGSSIMLSIASLIGIPIKAAALENKVIEPKKSIKTVVIWNKFTIKAYTKSYIKENYPNWGRAEWSALSKLWGKESGWNHLADNPESSAFGVAQVLNTDPGTPAPLQVEKGLSYIVHRYDLPSIAWAHWRKNGWY